MSLASPQLAAPLPRLDPVRSDWQRCAALARVCDTGWAAGQGLTEVSGVAGVQPLLLRITAPAGSLLLQAGVQSAALQACAALQPMAQRDASLNLLVWSLLGWFLEACGQNPDSVQCQPEPATAPAPLTADANGVANGAADGTLQPALYSQGQTLVLRYASPAWVQALEHYLRGRPVRGGGLACQLRLPCRLLCGQACLPAAALGHLRSGDVLLGERSGSSLAQALAQAPLSLHWGDPTLAHLCAEVSYQDGTMTLQQHPRPANALVQEDLPQEAGAAWPLRWQQLELRVQFVLDASPMTLAELTTLGPGQVLQLPEPAPERVRLLVQGQTLGFGELLLVGERLGVRLHAPPALPLPPAEEGGA